MGTNTPIRTTLAFLRLSSGGHVFWNVLCLSQPGCSSGPGRDPWQWVEKTPAPAPRGHPGGHRAGFLSSRGSVFIRTWKHCEFHVLGHPHHQMTKMICVAPGPEEGTAFLFLICLNQGRSPSV